MKAVKEWIPGVPVSSLICKNGMKKMQTFADEMGKKTPNCSVLYIEHDKRLSIQQLKFVDHFDWFRYSVENLDVGLKTRSSLLGVTFVSCFLFLGYSLDIWYDHVHAFINLPRFGVASCSIW